MIVKVCGLNTVEAVAAAVAAGADAVGLVLAPSVRRVTPEQARSLLEVAEGVARVAVFRALDRTLLDAVSELPFDAIQADADSLAGLGPADLGGRFAIPVFHDGPDLGRRVAAWRGGAPTPPAWADAVLVDGPVGGGAGIAGDLDRVAVVARQRPIVLAGGLRPDTVAAAIARVRPAGVDVSSGVERAPGVKDPARIEAFVRAARAALEEAT